MANWGEVMI